MGTEIALKQQENSPQEIALKQQSFFYLLSVPVVVVVVVVVLTLTHRQNQVRGHTKVLEP